MSWTKRELIADAFGELALANFDFDISPEEEQAALRRLNSIMATWTAKGIRLGYHMSVTADADDLDEPSGLPLYANEAVYMALAKAIAASKGKALPRSTLANAKAAYDAVIAKVAAEQVQQQQLASGTPRGAGRKPWRTVNQPFVQTPNDDPLRSGPDGGLILSGK